MKAKKILFIVLLLTYELVCFSQNIKALDEKYGFREMQFGDSLSKFEDLIFIEYSLDSLTALYSRTNDKLKIGDANVTISYGFYKGEFYLVYIKTNGVQNCHSLLEAIFELYGKGDKPNRYMESYYWFGKKVYLSYHESDVTHDASILMTSKSIEKKCIEDRKNRAKQARSDF